VINIQLIQMYTDHVVISVSALSSVSELAGSDISAGMNVRPMQSIRELCY